MHRVAIVGASGYTGAELVEIALRHPGVEVVGVFGSASREGASSSIADLHPRLTGRIDLPVRAGTVEGVLAVRPRAVFLATPHEASLELAPALADAGVVVVDLSAAFRLKERSVYPRYYGFEHTRAAALDRAVYGLPELFRDRVARAELIAAPGCYPTSAILPLAPLARAGAIRPGWSPIIDSTSGVSGAGRSAQLRSLFCEVSQQPYGVLSHRHGPEIDAYAGVRTIFTPHLGPYDRGIVSTIHVALAPGWDETRARGELVRAYAGERFIRFLRPGVWPSVAGVRGTNYCDIAMAFDAERSHLIVVSAIDNLLKGASGQAMQCLNVRLGMDEGWGLDASRGVAS